MMTRCCALALAVMVAAAPVPASADVQCAGSPTLQRASDWDRVFVAEVTAVGQGDSQVHPHLPAMVVRFLDIRLIEIIHGSVEDLPDRVQHTEFLGVKSCDDIEDDAPQVGQRFVVYQRGPGDDRAASTLLRPLDWAADYDEELARRLGR